VIRGPGQLKRTLSAVAMRYNESIVATAGTHGQGHRVRLARQRLKVGREEPLSGPLTPARYALFASPSVRAGLRFGRYSKNRGLGHRWGFSRSDCLLSEK
jgi:hypothetical protein